jgi:hypothetical protein
LEEEQEQGVEKEEIMEEASGRVAIVCAPNADIK